MNPAIRFCNDMEQSSCQAAKRQDRAGRGLKGRKSRMLRMLWSEVTEILRRARNPLHILVTVESHRQSGVALDSMLEAATEAA